MTSIYTINGGADLSKSFPDDDPQVALEDFERNLRAKLEMIVHDMRAEEAWLQFNGVDVSLERIMSGWEDDISDEIGQAEIV